MGTSREPLLIITQSIPSDTGMGVSMRCGAWVEALASRYAVTLLVVSADPAFREAEITEKWRTLCDQVLCEHVAVEAQAVSRSVLRRLASRQPRMWARWPVVALRSRLAARLAQGHLRSGFTATLVFRLCMQPTVIALKGLGVDLGRTVVDIDDLESQAAQRQIQVKGRAHFGRIGVVLERMDVGRLQRAQQQVAELADAVVLSSETAAAGLRDLLSFQSRHKARAIRNVAAEVPDALPRHGSADVPRRAINLLFVGALDYPPNEHAVDWWCKHVDLRTLKSAHGFDARFRVVGRNPPEWMRHTADHFELHANVPDLKPFYAAADIVVVPLHMGGGTRLKIIEALAYGRPVVASTVGAEGLELINGLDFIEANRPEEFIQAVASLANDTQLYDGLVKRGRLAVLKRFNRESLKQEILNLFSGRDCAPSNDL